MLQIRLEEPVNAEHLTFHLNKLKNIWHLLNVLVATDLVVKQKGVKHSVTCQELETNL